MILNLDPMPERGDVGPQVGTSAKVVSMADRSVVLWSSLVVIYVWLACMAPLAESASSMNGVWLEWIVGSRLFLALAAATAAAWRLSGRPLAPEAGTVFFFFALGVQSAHAVLEGPNYHGFLFLTGVLFVATAAVFRSNRGEWLSIFLPLCAALLFVPALLKQDLAGALTISTVALVIGQAVASLRWQSEDMRSSRVEFLKLNETQTDMMRKIRRETGVADDAVRTFEEKMMNTRKPHDEKELVRDLQSPLLALQHLTHADDELSPASKKLMDEAIQRIRLITEQLAGRAGRQPEKPTHVRVVEAVRQGDPSAASLSESVSTVSVEPSALELTRGDGKEHTLAELMQMIDACLERKRAELGQSPRKISLSWLRSVDRELPVRVQINAEDFVSVISSLLDQGVEALGGNDGVINVGVHPGLNQVQVTVEDNGRGFSDEILQRMQMRGLLRIASREGRLSFKQIKALVSFWGGRVERHARLGVGSRVSLELPRVDAFATPVASTRQRALTGLTALRTESVTTLNVLS